MLKKIGIEHLRPGMYIHEICGSWMEHPFWRNSFSLKDPEDIRRLRESSVAEVWIDTDKGLDEESGQTREHVDAAVEEVLHEAARLGTPVQRVPLAEEVQRAAKICAKSKEAVVSMFHEVRMGKAVDAEAAEALVDEISSSIMRNPGALISLARLKTADDYTYLHSVAVSALMVALAHQLGLDDKETREVGLAGLLHDLGKALTPLSILNKPGKLTDEEFTVMKGHPDAGRRLLEDGRAVGEIPLDVCLHHHEKIDGSGYPDRQKSEGISLHARMGAVCDVYDAITSNRPYKAGWDPAESIRKMAEWSKGHFDEQVFHAFVKSIGIYPVGSLVRLESGRLGIVIEQSANNLLHPLVKVFFSTASGTYLQPEIIDLSRPNCPEKIAGREDAAKWGVKDLDRLWASS